MKSIITMRWSAPSKSSIKSYRSASIQCILTNLMERFLKIFLISKARNGALKRAKFSIRSKSIRMQTDTTWRRASRFSNSTWKDCKLTPVYRKPFDLLALANMAYQKGKAVSSKKDGLFEDWLPGQDSNLQPSG